MRISYKIVGFGFAAFSLIAIVWQHYGMTRVLRIDSSWAHFQAIDDSCLGAGTQSHFEVTDRGVLLTCDLTLDYQYPFCELAIYFPEQGFSGRDLTGYHTMVAALEYTSPGSDRMRIMLRNYSPLYSVENDYSTLKVNEIEYKPSSHPVLEIPLNHFQVASWWRHAMALSIDHIAPEFSGVTQIDLSTGGHLVPGRYTILLKYLEFRGKWIDAVTLYRGLLGMGLLLALIALLWELQQYRRRLHASHHRENELRSMNHLLELQSEKFEKLASHDPLTGVRNRAGIRDTFLVHIRNARQREQPLAAIFIDIDHFKVINDTGGHQLGDEILTEFANLIVKHIRDKDLFARWGGEEFLLLCPNTSLDDAHNLAEKLRILVVNHRWSEGLKLSASFGVTEFKDEEVALFIGRADTALYRAKAEGRNRVVTLAANTRKFKQKVAE